MAPIKSRDQIRSNTRKYTFKNAAAGIFVSTDNNDNKKPPLIVGLCRPTVSTASSVSGVKSYIEFSNFGSKAATCVLEQCLDELSIIDQFDLRTIGQSTVITELKKTMRHRCIERERHKLYNPDTMEPSDLPLVKLQFKKLNNTFIFLVQLVNCIRNDIKIARMCDTLQECVYYYQRRKHEEEMTLNRNKMDRSKVTSLREDLILNEKLAFEKERVLELESIKLELQTHDELVMKGIRSRLCDNYENARGDQMHKIMDDKETDLKKVIEELKVKTEWEMRIHMDLVKHLTSTTDLLQEQVNSWSDKYDEDLDRYESLILGSQLRKEEHTECLSRLRDEYAYRDQMIQDYLVVKQSKELMLAKVSAANTLQAWWRACIFRNRLIRTRKRKGGKNKAKGGKKSKK